MPTKAQVNATEKQKSKNRPALAKSKDPDFKASTLYLRKKTLADADHRLKTTDDGRDMSELMQDLLEAWLRSAKA